MICLKLIPRSEFAGTHSNCIVRCCLYVCVCSCFVFKKLIYYFSRGTVLFCTPISKVYNPLWQSLSVNLVIYIYFFKWRNIFITLKYDTRMNNLVFSLLSWLVWNWCHLFFKCFIKFFKYTIIYILFVLVVNSAIYIFV